MAPFLLNIENFQCFQVEEDLVALNVGICEVMLHLIVPPHKETENKIEHHATVVTLQYYESALYGMVCPCNFELSNLPQINK